LNLSREILEADFQSSGQPENRLESGVGTASLDLPDAGEIYVGAVGNLLLRQAELNPN
jgi:hypothetical protein